MMMYACGKGNLRDTCRINRAGTSCWILHSTRTLDVQEARLLQRKSEGDNDAM